MRFYKIYILSFITYSILIAIIGCGIVLIGFSMGSIKVPYILLMITKIILYPIVLLNSIIPDFFPEKVNGIIIIGVADLIVSFFSTVSVVGIRTLIKRI